jgi:hypothetical protein
MSGHTRMAESWGPKNTSPNARKGPELGEGAEADTRTKRPELPSHHWPQDPCEARTPRVIPTPDTHETATPARPHPNSAPRTHGPNPIGRKQQDRTQQRDHEGRKHRETKHAVPHERTRKGGEGTRPEECITPPDETGSGELDRKPRMHQIPPNPREVSKPPISSRCRALHPA